MSTMSSDGDVKDLTDRYARAVLEQDVDAFVSLYRDDVRVFDCWSEWAYDGLEAWRAMVGQWLGSLGESRVKVTFSEVRVQSGAEVAFLSAFVEYAAVDADGGTLHRMLNRLDWGLAKTGGAWQVMHEHTSAPADFETGRLLAG